MKTNYINEALEKLDKVKESYESGNDYEAPTKEIKVGDVLYCLGPDSCIPVKVEITRAEADAKTVTGKVAEDGVLIEAEIEVTNLFTKDEFLELANIMIEDADKEFDEAEEGITDYVDDEGTEFDIDTGTEIAKA